MPFTTRVGGILFSRSGIFNLSSLIGVFLLFSLLFPGHSLSAETSELFRQGVDALQKGHLSQAQELFRSVVARDPQNALAFFNLGSIMEVLRQFPEAEKNFRIALQLQPRLVAAYLHLAQIRRGQGDNDGAFEDYFLAYWLSEKGSIVEQLGEDGLAAIHNEEEVRSGVDAAQKAIREGRAAEAEEELREVLGITPENPLALNLLGITLGIEGQYGEAIDVFHKTLELRPLLISGWVRLGELLELKADWTGARDAYETALLLEDDEVGPEHEDVEKHLRSVEDRIDLKEFMELGDKSFNAGEFEAAVKAYEAASEFYPQEDALYFKIGISYLRLNRNDRALSFLEKAEEKNPQNALVKQAIGGIREAMNFFNRAEKSYRAALALVSGGAIRDQLREALVRLPTSRDQAAARAQAKIVEGNGLLESGKKEEGLQRLQEAALLSPENPEIHAALFRVYEAVGDIDLAMNSLRGVLEFSPSAQWPHKELARLYAGKHFFGVALTETEKAGSAAQDPSLSALEREIRENLSVAAEREKPFLAEARRQYDLAELDGALASAQKGALERPDDPEILVLIAGIEWELGHHAKARTGWEEAVLLDPNSARYTLGFAQVLERLGVWDEAQKMYKKGLQLAQGGPSELSRAAQEGIDRISVGLFHRTEARRYLNRGILRLKKEDYAGAEQAFRVVIVFQPDDVLAQYDLAFAEQMQGKLPEAEAGYKRDIVLSPAYANPRYYLGKVYVDEGKWPEAIEQYHLALNLLSGTGQPEEGLIRTALATVEKRYTLALSESTTFDSNIVLGPVQVGEVYSILGATYDYYFIKRQRFSLPLEFTSYAYFYHISGNAINNNSLSLIPRYEFSNTFSTTLRYTFGYTWASGGVSNNSNMLGIDLTHLSTWPSSLTLHYDYQLLTYFINPLFDSSRSTFRLSAVENFLTADNLSLSGVFSTNNVSTPFLNTRSESGQVSYTHSFTEKLKGVFGLGLSLTQYTTFNFLEFEITNGQQFIKRKNIDESISATIYYFLRPELSLSLSVSQEWLTSNLPNFSSTQVKNPVINSNVPAFVANSEELIVTGTPVDIGPFRKTVITAGLSWSF